MASLAALTSGIAGSIARQQGAREACSIVSLLCAPPRQHGAMGLPPHGHAARQAHSSTACSDTAETAASSSKDASSSSGGTAGGGGGSSSSGTAGGLQITVEPLADKYEGVSVISLARAEVKNAIGRRLLRELREAVDLLRQERTTRCVILRSAVPGVFCVGADLKERATMTQVETVEFVTTLRKTFSEVEALPMPTIAAVDGFALGGGAELALAADIRVAGQAAVFAFPEAGLGIIPGAGGTQRLPRIIGRPRTKDLVFTARRVKADEALALGLVDHLVPDNQAYTKALAIAADIAKCAPLSLRMAKAAIDHGMDVNLSTGLRMEEAYYAQLIPTKDRLEGLKAFAEKRAPVYKGE